MENEPRINKNETNEKNSLQEIHDAVNKKIVAFKEYAQDERLSSEQKEEAEQKANLVENFFSSIKFDFIKPEQVFLVIETIEETDYVPKIVALLAELKTLNEE